MSPCRKVGALLMQSHLRHPEGLRARGATSYWSAWPRLQVEAFRSVLNNTSNELRLLQQHVEEKKGAVLVQKG